MSTRTTSYGDKIRQGRRMYGPMPVPPDLGYPNADAIRARYGDHTPVIYRDAEGRPVRRSRT